jgi:ACS family pantothenate transporter-like MFS transporter
MAENKTSTEAQILPATDNNSFSAVDGLPKDGFWINFLTKVGWYPTDMPSAEKLLVLKLDLMILVFGGLSFFTKYLDQAAITNAYVS